jgi:serine/threonine-protein kinase
VQLGDQLQDALGSDYRVEQELDGGGMSRLFVATDLRLGRRVVVKVLAPELVTGTSRARFRREIELTVRLQHPHILPVLTSGAWGDVLYYVTPFIPGESLRVRLAREGALPFEDALRIVRDVCGALAFAHHRGVVHRDVKPGNVLLAEGHAILADFGIARAVLTSATPLTGSGMTPGTPAYMAPELPTDETADVYALGVVAYEMLCGALPRRGVTAKEIVAARGRARGDDARLVRRFAAVIADALSTRPERRIPTAAVLGRRLDEITMRRDRVSWGAMAAVAAAVTMVIGARDVVRLRRAAPRADTYAVVRLGAGGASDEVAQAITDALAEWQGVAVVDATASRDREPGRVVTMADAAAAARRSAARNVVALDERMSGDSIVVRATLYDDVADSAIATRRAAFGAHAAPADRTMTARRFVNALLRVSDELPWRQASDQVAPNLAAWRAYDAGRAALRRWDLAGATRAFEEATGRDATLARAQLWLAQALEWRRGVDRASDLRVAARRAVDARAALTSRDSLHAAALLALTEARFSDACTAFADLIARDSSDLAGWLGAADCRAYDRAVVRGGGTGGAWSFRGSFEAAARAYQRASDLGAGDGDSPFRGWVLGRISNVLYTTTNHVRTGYAATATTGEGEGEGEADSTFFAAFPQLDHDTLVFVPMTRVALARGDGPGALAIRRAVTRNRQLLRSAAEDWVRHAPRSAAAYDTLAAWTEVSGGIANVGERATPTLAIVQRALTLATDPAERWRLGVSEVRLLIKGGAFDEARQRAESLLAHAATARVPATSGVPGLAALLGHPNETAVAMLADSTLRLVLTANGPPVALPEQLLVALGRLRAYAWLDGPRDTIRTAADRVLELITTYFPDSSAASRVRAVTVPIALSFANGATRATYDAAGESLDDVANAYRALARGDSAAARAKLRAVRRSLSGELAGSSIDGNFRRARLAAMLGDTTVARAELDPILRALPTLAPALLDRPEQAASLVRALVLRAEIADRQGDRATAQDCARAVVALWKDADPSLQPVVARMQALAR